jgi:serine/threonine-protein kinase RsbW
MNSASGGHPPHHPETCFSRTGIAADAHGAALTRAHFGQWLAQHLPLDESRLGDLLLATYEALANAAEHAYLQSSVHDTMDLHAHYESDPNRFVVTVSDQGQWPQPLEASAEAASSIRGRGIPLMRALADEATIRTNEGGSQIRLSWHRAT